MTSTAPDLTSVSWQPDLFGMGEPGVDPTFAGVQRTMLDDESWIDHQPGWLSGADELFQHLLRSAPWRQREVVMYDQLVAEPRLTAWWSAAMSPEPPHPVLASAIETLSRRYSRPFDSIGFNLYRDGRDSVAWHADRERFHLENPVVVVVSMGATRTFQIRPKGGGPSTTFRVAAGDLLAMGGACQHQWEHCVPKSAAVRGPRLSIQFRHHLADWQPPEVGTYNSGGATSEARYSGS